MRMFTRLQARNIDIFKLDICIRNLKPTIERPISKSWFEFRILGFGLDIDFNPKCTCPHECTHRRIKMYPVAMDTRHLVMPAIKRLFRRTN